MTEFDIRDLKARALEGLEPHRDRVRRQVMIFTGALAVLALGGNGLNLLLDRQIGGTGGLGGMELRSLLQTLQRILGYVNTFFGPFWSAGFLYSLLMTLRGQEPRTGNLFEGFRRGGRILGGLFFEITVYFLLAMGVANIASMIVGLTPLGQRLVQAVSPILESEAFLNQGLIDPTLVSAEEVLGALLPVLGVFFALLIPACIFFSYQFRMAVYLMMDRPISGSRAHFLSAALLRGRKWQLFKLDLSFWWYYLLSGLVNLAAYLDAILILLGVELPFGQVVWFFGTLVLYCGLLMALNLWKKPQVDSTYLAAFEQIAHPAE